MVSEIEQIVKGEHPEAFRILGIHPGDRNGEAGVWVRAFLPQARQAFVILLDEQDQEHEMENLHPDGFWAAFFPGRQELFRYRLKLLGENGAVQVLEDPYRFPLLLTDFDLYLIGEGSHQQYYEKLGAHLWELEGVPGVRFAVWAPNAICVSVIGNFNEWDGRRHPMRRRGGAGIWELFVPGIGEGEIYKYEIKSRSNPSVLQKADPVEFYAEVRPKSASIVFNLDRY
ncbi:MAG: 1,4-alpha-glucan branching enzyme, partial [Acidobacteria bacterium]|nr:1,4-alpha-glucan branching enzyme [Acidobacteriota bacterium]